jgi:hypothetical protein
MAAVGCGQCPCYDRKPMTCCIFGVLATTLVLWVRAFVRQRVLGREPPPDPTAWHLPLPPDRD